MRIPIGAAMLCIAATSSAVAEESPWEPAKTGKIECLGSNLANRTCESMTVYRWLEGGGVSAESRSVSRDGEQGIVAVSKRQAQIDGNTKCTITLQRDIDTTVFLRDGKPVAEAERLKLQSQMQDSLSEDLGRRHCLRIGRLGREYTVQLTINGREMPSDANWMAWIDEKDGFSLLP